MLWLVVAGPLRPLHPLRPLRPLLDHESRSIQWSLALSASVQFECDGGSPCQRKTWCERLSRHFMRSLRK